MNKQGPPFLTIFIPTWNRVKPVLEAVKSIGPILSDMEVVIVDNASEPAVFEELQHSISSNPSIKLFRNEHNLGMVRNWNRCLEESQGEWLGLLCSDDSYLPGTIGRLRAIAKTQLEPALIIQAPDINCAFKVCSPGSETIRDLRLPIASGNFWHRRAYEQIGGFDERFEYSADAEYWYRIAYSFPVVKIRDPFAIYVSHQDNYMWATWRRPDFLQQTELLARTVAGYSYSVFPDQSAMIEREVATGLWQTMLSIIKCTFLVSGKMDIFYRYLSEALQHANTFSYKKQLASALLTASIQRCRKLVSGILPKNSSLDNRYEAEN